PVHDDGGTDDARLPVANATAPEQGGGSVRSHTRVTEILRNGGKAVGVSVKSQLMGETREMRARVLGNATGVWQNELDGGARTQRHRGSKGVHIAVPRERVGNRDGITMISAVDGRVMFCLPAGPQTIIG